MSNLNFYGTDVKRNFQLVSCFEPIDVLTLQSPTCTVHTTNLMFLLLLYEISMIGTNKDLSKIKCFSLLLLLMMNYRARIIIHSC